MSMTELPISKELLDILRCPLAVQEKEKYGSDPGKLTLAHNTWLVSEDTGLKYPIRDGIPIMLIDEGKKWQETEVDALPVPPPAAQPIPSSHTTTSTLVAKKSNKKKYLLIAAAGLILLRFFRRDK